MKILFQAAFVFFALLVGVAGAKDKNKNTNNFEAKLSGYNEVHFIAGNPAAVPIVPPALRGAVSSQASGKFQATINGSVINYVISYTGLESDVTQSHIHFGQRHTVGGIVVWLCQTPGTPAPSSVAALTPFCPSVDPRSGTVSGTITQAQVLTVTGQGIDAGQFDELVRAIRAGIAYANVHTTVFTPGEIRGQIKASGKGDDDDDDEDED